jgi:hypothetical protein
MSGRPWVPSREPATKCAKNPCAKRFTAAPPPSPAVLAGQIGIAPLTRVSLAYIEQLIDV